MTCRKYPLYKLAFQLIKANFPDFEPRHIMTDFEAGLRKAILEVFPDTRLAGCR